MGSLSRSSSDDSLVFFDSSPVPVPFAKARARFSTLPPTSSTIDTSSIIDNRRPPLLKADRTWRGSRDRDTLSSTSHPYPNGLPSEAVICKDSGDSSTSYPSRTSRSATTRGLLERARSLYLTPSSTSPPLGGSGAGQDVILRFEYLTDNEYMATYLVIIAASLVVVAVTVMLTATSVEPERPGNHGVEEVTTLTYFWVLAFLFVVDVLNLSLYIERLIITRRQSWSSTQRRMCATSLSIQCATVLYVGCNLGLFGYALFAANPCPYQGRFSEAVRACRWLLITIFWFCVVMQITDHVLTREGEMVRRPPRVYAHPNNGKKGRGAECCGLAWFRVKGGFVRLFVREEAWLNLPPLICLVLAFVAFCLEVAKVQERDSGYYSDRCDTYLAATTDQERYNSLFCRDIRDESGTYGVFEVVVILCFFVLFVGYTLLARYRLLRLPWVSHRTTNISLRVLIVQSTPPLAVMLASKLCFVFLRNDDGKEGCGTKAAVTNSPELSIIISAWTAVRLYCASPIMPGEYRDQIRQRTVQHFLWQEPGPRVVTTEPFWAHEVGPGAFGETRVDYGRTKLLKDQPVFVFETMVKMLFWAEVIYLKEAQDETEPARAVAGVRDPEHVPEKARKGRKGRVSSKPEGSELRPPRAPKARRRATAFQKAWAEETAEYGLPANGSAPDGIGSAGSDASVKSQKPQAMTFEAAVAVGMRHYDLKYYKIFHEPSSESKVVVAWNAEGMVVVSFRGTVHVSNMLTDVSCVRTIWKSMEHKANRSNLFRKYWHRPTIHHGFKRAMKSENVGLELTSFVAGLVNDTIEAAKFRPCVRVTGHSLGGALAVLMSHEILESCSGLRSSEISVWTFGCPGVCNRSARNIYQSCIPTTFHVINNVDFIAYTGTWLQFKKPGIPVLINNYGDLIYRPTLVEGNLHHSYLRESLKDHFMGSYRLSVAKIIELNCEVREELQSLLLANPLIKSVLSEEDLARLESGDSYEGTISGRAYVLGVTSSIGALEAVGKGMRKGVNVVSGSIFKNRKSVMKALSDEDEKMEKEDKEKEDKEL